MAITLNDLKIGHTIRAPRMLLIGVEKIGKTSFATGTAFDDDGAISDTGLNSPVVIPCKGEEGADGMKVPVFPTCASYNDVLDCIGALFSEDHVHKTAVLDSASALGPIVNDDVCTEFQVDNVRKVPGFRTGEAAVLNRWRNILNGLDSLRNEKNMASIIIGHTKIKKHKNPDGDDYDTYDIDLEHTDVAELLKRWADVILFCNTKVVVKKDGEDAKFAKAKRRGIDATGGRRFLYTQKRPTHPGGGRGPYGQLPYELPLNWTEFENAVARAME